METASFINWITPPGLLISALAGEFVDLQLQIETDGKDVTFTIIDGICPAPFFSDGKISGPLQSVNQSIEFNFTVRAQSTNIISDRSFSIFVTFVNAPPKWLNELNLGNLFVDQNFYLAFSVESSLPVSYTVTTTLPTGLFLSGATIQGSLSNANPEGAGSFQVVANNGTFSTPATFTYRIIKQNLPPQWQTAPYLGFFTQGQNVNLKLIANDPNGNPIRYRMPFGQGCRLRAAIVDGEVLTLTILNPGQDYVNTPPNQVNFYSGTPAQATAALDMMGEVDELIITNPGSNYSQPPNVILSGGGGLGAEFKAIISGGRVVAFEKISGGSGYVSPPTVTFTTFLNPAVATATALEGRIVSTTLSSPGDAYLFPPTVTVESPQPPLGGGALPLGLRVTINGEIVGSISMEAEPKTYNFVVTASDGVNPPVARTFSLDVLPYQSFTFNNVNISWNTPSGSLGSIFERYPSYFQISADTSSPNPIEYTLAPGSNPLPPGIELDLYSGSLTGWFQPTGVETTYSFTVRAQVQNLPSVFTDRIFEITVLPRFTVNSENYWSLVTGSLKLDIANDIFSVIQAKDIFGFFNDDFGIIKTPRLLVAGGCVVKTDAQTWNFIKRQEDEFGNPIPLSTYHTPLQLVLGNLKIVPTFAPNSTTPFADAIVAEVIDPGEVKRNEFVFGAGGWVGNVNVGVETNNPLAPMIYPNTLSNIRLAFQNQIGYAGTQFLPWYMLRTGYQPSFEILYVNPGRGSFVLEQLLPIWNQKYRGQPLILDRYYKTTSTNENIRIFNFDVDAK